MKKMSLLTPFAILVLCGVVSEKSFAQNVWQPAGEKIRSVFAKNVNPAYVHQEYPRPQMTRQNNWQNLNGLWDYAIVPVNEEFKEPQGKILVPFAVESSLSGVGKTVKKENNLFYKRDFKVPLHRKGKRILLHFGAVDWQATVYVNGKEVGSHKGGYTPFSFDITDVLTESGPQELLVKVWDPTDESTYPRGKQVNNPRSIWYTSVTGIWQTVWLETVPETHIDSLKLTPSLKDGTITVETKVNGVQDGDKLVITASAGRRTVASAAPQTGEAAVLKINNPVSWTPERPYLYDLQVHVLRGNRLVDSVTSYFALRDVTLGKDCQGITRILLNGKFVFQHGPLDQGWWPDGLYTAPTDAALRYDIEMTKKMGFNMLRKHVKVEPARFYYWCDKLGILVWQDMPSSNGYVGGKIPDSDMEREQESADQFYAEWTEIINSFYNHPSIIMWVPFNEGWGQFKTVEVVDYTQKTDPTRLVNNASGWTDYKVGHVNDIHSYPNPAMPEVEENRAVVLGEYGGLGLPVENHTWLEKGNWGYVSYKDGKELLDAYITLNKRMHPLIAKGLSAAVYTQTTDVEIECNGLMTYDRAVVKMDLGKLSQSNLALHYPAPSLKEVVPTSEKEAQEWKCTIEQPAEDWFAENFDDSAWMSGPGGFGKSGTPGAVVRTEWTTGSVWIRRSFELSEEDLAARKQFSLNLHHDEDAEVYINGVLAARLKGYSNRYNKENIAPAALNALKSGKNVIAIKCVQTGGGQYIDAGLTREVPAQNPKQPVW
ncbi:MAG: hypothetical protein LBQ54_09180 [Planctomycetaceae bacterium]|jgi:hypothetical protein|nr:hypothetical protein [Planctomycetaceae bacterium]